MSISKERKVEVCWRDAIVYRNGPPATLPQKVTVGVLIRASDRFVLIKNPRTKAFNRAAGRFEADRKEPSYFFIPRGMIEHIDRVGE